MRDCLVKVFYEKAKQNKNLVFVTGDLGFNVVNKIYDDLPLQFINAGIAEQNMTSLAAGLGLEGKCVFTYSIGNFSTLRCLEQIRNDICYHNSNVKVVALAAGFAYGALGMSHHSTEDIACMRSLPNMVVFSPCDPVETKAVTEAAIAINGPCFIRLGRGGEPTLWDHFGKFEVGKAYKMYDGDDFVIFSTGSITAEAVNAVKKLKEEHLNVALYTFPTIKPIDQKLIEECARRFKYIITLEEHQISGGFGSAVSEVLAKISGNKSCLIPIGLKDTYTSIVGDTNYLRKVYEVDSTAIIRTIKGLAK